MGGERGGERGNERARGSAQLSESCPHPLNGGCDER